MSPMAGATLELTPISRNHGTRGYNLHAGRINHKGTKDTKKSEEKWIVLLRLRDLCAFVVENLCPLVPLHRYKKQLGYVSPFW